jgi:hypothetical protein
LREPVTARASIDRAVVGMVATLDLLRKRFFVSSDKWPVAAGRYYVGRKDHRRLFPPYGIELLSRPIEPDFDKTFGGQARISLAGVRQ